MTSPTSCRGRVRWTMAVFALLCAAGLSLAQTTQSATLALVSTAWPPFTNAPGEPRFALDLVEAAFSRIGVTAKTTIVAAPEFTASLLGGEFDGSGAAWKDPERERVLLLSQPYLENRLVLVGRRGADVSAKALSDLVGKRVAIVEGYSYGEAVERSGPVFVRSHGEEDSLARLLKGDVDYTFMDDLGVQYVVSNYPKESASKLQIGTTPLVTRELYLAIRRTRPDAEAIITRFNAQLRGMISDRTYHRLLHLDWISADVNGDGISEYVPLDDKTGPLAPERIYKLFSTTVDASESAKPGFYVGGTIYSDWASVPESYKDINPKYPDARRSTASIFKFVW